MNFKDKTLKEIRLWAWAVAVLPITGLAGLFFIWVFGTEDLYALALVTGFTLMFAAAVVWWWWVIYTVRNLVFNLTKTKEDIEIVHETIQIVKNAIKDSVKDN